MDLRAFYQKIRQLEREIPGDQIIVVSNETPDGGRSGQVSEVPKAVGARMIVEGRARLATLEESTQYRAGVQKAMEQARRAEIVRRTPARLLSDADVEALRSALRPVKGS